MLIFGSENFPKKGSKKRRTFMNLVEPKMRHFLIANCTHKIRRKKSEEPVFMTFSLQKSLEDPLTYDLNYIIDKDS